MLVTGEGSTLKAKNFLHFSTQCKKSSQGGCPDDGGNQNPIASNDYIDIGGQLIVGGGNDQSGIRTFGGKDVFIVRPGAVVDVTKDIDLGGQNDQFIVGGKVAVADGLRLGGGNDIFRVTEGGFFESGPDKKGTSNIAFSSGQDTLENAGMISTSWGIVFQGGASDDGDQLINLPSGEIQTYAGINFVDSERGTIDNSGLIEVALENPDGRQIVFGDGDDRILNRAGGVIDVKGTINMGDGDDLIVNNGTLRVTRDIQMRGGDDWFALSGEGLELQNGSKVDGGEGLDQLVFSDQEFSSEVPGGVDVSQQSSSGRILIDADEVAKRFVNFENAIQYKGSYEYQGDFSSNFERVTIRDGVMVVRDTEPVVFQNLELEKDGTIVVGLSKSDSSSKSSRPAPITVTSLQKSGGFTYQSGGKFVISADAQDDPQGTYFVIDGNVNNADQLAANTSLVYDCDLDSNSDCTEERFSGVGQSGGIETVFNDIYLQEGSLQLVVEAKENPILPGPDEPNGPGSDDSGGTDDPSSSSDDPDQDGDGELDALPGCDVGSDLCDLISDIPGDEDDALPEEEHVIEDVFDSLVDGVQDDDVELPLIDYGTLAQLVASGLAPRNVDAAGRGLALHNNLLVDAVFDRQPLRQFEKLLVTEEVVEEAPVQPLWLKAEELSDGEATVYVEGAVADVEVADAAVEVADAAVVAVAESEAVVVEFDGVSYADLQDDELDLAKRDGVSAWVKGFGGNSRADDSSILYNDYDFTAYGTSFGVDVALSDTFQIGAYANYGDLDVHHRSGDTGGGSWNPEGWGGGLTAQYSTRNFYVQGLLGASEFSGDQSRNILQITSDLGGNTAKGDKSVTSYLGALRVGAPFKTGGVVLEPQGQVVWTRNHEQGFSETRGTEKNLRLKYKSRTTNFAETELGMKLSVPVRTGERGLLVPSVRAAWLADWNQANEGQEIGYKFTNKTVNFDSQLGTENGALIEAGLDYTVQNFNGVSVKLYGRGGMEFWASDRGTTWRASGGVTFQF